MKLEPAKTMEEFYAMDGDPRAFACLDCGEDTSRHDGLKEFYCLRHLLWRELVPERWGMLCVGCLGFSEYRVETCWSIRYLIRINVWNIEEIR